MSKKGKNHSSQTQKQFNKNLKLQNSFQQPGNEMPIEQDISSKWAREQIVKRFLEEKDGNVKN